MMNEEQKRYFLTAGIFVFLVLICLDLFILTREIKQNNNVFYEKHIEYLEEQNEKVQSKIDTLNQILIGYKVELKKISEQKDKIKAIYIKADEKIDTLDANELVYEFSIFFSKISQK